MPPKLLSVGHPGPGAGPGVVLSLLCLTLAGCGSIGDTMPPLLNIPARVTDLDAVERGSKVIVQFTFPHLTTEGTLIKHPAHAELHIGPPVHPFSPEAWAAGTKSYPDTGVVDGRERFEVPASDWMGKDVLVAVMVIGANRRHAGWSNFKTLSVVPAPGAPSGLHADSVRDGVRLTWHGRGDSFRVFRRLEPETVWLPAGTSEQPDFTDTKTEYGKHYQYAVQALTKAGDSAAESELSEPEGITPVDKFSPATPAGLTVVPSTTSIELVWERNTEPDLAGYRLYRSLGTGPFERIAEIRDVPSYSDSKIRAGQVYRYAVSAFDNAGNESPRSEPSQVTAP